jgi:hypothetical protein
MNWKTLDSMTAEQRNEWVLRFGVKPKPPCALQTFVSAQLLVLILAFIVAFTMFDTNRFTMTTVEALNVLKFSYTILSFTSIVALIQYIIYITHYILYLYSERTWLNKNDIKYEYGRWYEHIYWSLRLQ